MVRNLAEVVASRGRARRRTGSVLSEAIRTYRLKCADTGHSRDPDWTDRLNT
jgi:hypothetical protein